MIENLSVSFPFIIFLLYKQFYLIPVVLTVFALLFASVNTKIPSIIVIPTPFGKYPYEFASGFRKTFLLFFAAYGLTVIAVIVDNFNLGMFTLALNMFVICNFYLQEENVYYVWQYAMTSTQFLFYKTKIAFIYSFLANSPAILILSIFYPENIPVIFVCLIIGLMYLTLSIMIKYDAFPDKLSIPKSFVMIVCLLFPPLLVVMIPYMSNRAARQLTQVLKQ
jgi:hypothetical protein